MERTIKSIKYWINHGMTKSQRRCSKLISDARVSRGLVTSVGTDLSHAFRAQNVREPVSVRDVLHLSANNLQAINYNKRFN
jgi:hypothetical protein